MCDPSWTNASDTSHSKAIGGRWNPPDRPSRPGFGALYLNSTIDVARANARRHVYESFGLSIDDLVDGGLHHRVPDLQHYRVKDASFVDAVTREAIVRLGLASPFPAAVPHPPCQGIAEEAYARGELGIVTLSAVASGDEELVIFDRFVSALARKTKREKFSAWY